MELLQFVFIDRHDRKQSVKVEVPIVPVTITGIYRMYEQQDGKIKDDSDVKRSIEEAIHPESYHAKSSNEIAEGVQEIIEKRLQ
ncbi:MULTISPECIES: hypothetical protein [Virgibacillus]|uniref:hypothetical protein n=1 Tax=Virgibacillus TaxID=84406 RepID=UPI000AF0E70E|nr:MULTISPECIES: hypothetical protein [Virgibacillus]